MARSLSVRGIVWSILPWAAVVLALFSIHWAAGWTYGEIEDGIRYWPPIFQFILLMAIVICAVFGVWWFRGRFLSIQTKIGTNDEVLPRKHLILFLSEMHSKPEYDDGVPDFFDITGQLVSDLSNLSITKQGKSNWNWEMPLRAVSHHSPEIQTISFLCSTRSAPQIQMFLRLLDRFEELKSTKRFVLTNQNGRFLLKHCEDFSANSVNGLDFEDFRQQYQALSTVITEIIKKTGASEREIVVDITGGQKPSSVVAAMATLNRRVGAQYVQTTPPYRIKGYDLWAVFGEAAQVEL